MPSTNMPAAIEPADWPIPNEKNEILTPVEGESGNCRVPQTIKRPVIKINDTPKSRVDTWIAAECHRVKPKITADTTSTPNW